MRSPPKMSYYLKMIRNRIINELRKKQDSISAVLGTVPTWRIRIRELRKERDRAYRKLNREKINVSFWGKIPRL
jgi:hypothetical protein